MNGMTELQLQLQNVLINVLIGLITVAGTYATLYIKKAVKKAQLEIDKVENEQQRDFMSTALERLDDVTLKAVTKLQETVAKSIRKSIEEGQTPERALSSLAEEAKIEIEHTLEPIYLSALRDQLGDFDTYVKNLIEVKVAEVKNEATTGGTA